MDGHEGGSKTVRYAEIPQLGLNGPKWANNMSIESQIDMEMIFLGFSVKNY